MKTRADILLAMQNAIEVIEDVYKTTDRLDDDYMEVVDVLFGFEKKNTMLYEKEVLIRKSK